MPDELMRKAARSMNAADEARKFFADPLFDCDATYTIACPNCGGDLVVVWASYNGHISGRCATPDCCEWME